MTDARGGFTYGALPVGRYSLAATLQSFKPQQVSDVRVSIDGVASVKIKMQLASFTGEMTVTAAPPLLDTVSSSVDHRLRVRVHQGPPDAQQLHRHHRGVAGGQRAERGEFPALGLRRQRDVSAVEHRRSQPGVPRGRLAGLVDQPGDRAGDFAQGLRGRGGVRQHDGQRLQHGHQVRDQRAPRLGRRLLDDERPRRPERRARHLEALLLSPLGSGRGVHHRRLLRRPCDHRRADRPRQALVLRRRPVGQDQHRGSQRRRGARRLRHDGRAATTARSAGRSPTAITSTSGDTRRTPRRCPRRTCTRRCRPSSSTTSTSR